MKKIKYLLLIAIISFFVLPGNISASAPASLFNVVTLYGGVDGSIQTNEFVRGESYNIMTYSSGGYLNRTEYLTYELDESIFEITNFYSVYGFIYNDGKIKLEGDKLLNEGFSTREPASLWLIQVKVKDNAKLGKIKINGVSYEIVCGENEQYETNNNNNNDEIQKPDNTKNDSNIGNNESNKLILDDTKFYILAGLFGTTVIELLVLILKKTKKA